MRRYGVVLLAALILCGRAEAEDLVIEETPCAPHVSEAAACRWSFTSEVLVWWLRNGRIPPMLTSGPSEGGGRLDQPGTVVVYGNEKLDVNRHLGGRFNFEYWLDDDRSLGLQLGGFVIERNSRTFDVESVGDVQLARPYTNALNGGQESEIVAGFAPGIGNLSGSFYGFTKNELFGQTGSLTTVVCQATDYRLDASLGVYCLQMRERLEFTATSKLLPEEAIIFGVTDKYKVYNRFYGGQLGLAGEYRLGPFQLQGRGILALGDNERLVRAFGTRLVATPLERVEVPYGLMVLPTNSGKFHDNGFDVVYEIGLNVGCDLCSSCRVFAGYTLIYWTNFVRAGDQVDVVINPTQIGGGLPAGPGRPEISFTEDYFWAQGASVGLEVRW